LAEREPIVEALRLKVEVAVVQGDLSRAQELLGRAQTEAQVLQSSYQLAGVERAFGRFYLAHLATARAVLYLEGARKRFEQGGGPDEVIVTLYWLGTAYLLDGQTRKAEDALRRACGLAMEIGELGILAGPAAEDLRLLQHGMQLNEDVVSLSTIERAALTRQPWSGLIQAPLHVQGPGSKMVVSGELPKVEVRLLGSFAIHLDGQWLDPGARGAGRAHELFALLALHPDGLPGSDIAEMLWPDMPVERAQHNLQMTAYLLRRLLATKGAVRYSRSRYQLAASLIVWADLRVFDELLARAKLASDEDAVRLLEEAVEIARGPVLAGMAWEWVEAFRERHRLQLTAALIRLADLLAATDLSASERLVERILTLEPDNEDAFERLLGRARDRGDALATLRIQRRYKTVMEGLGLRANPRFLAIKAAQPADGRRSLIT
jgi:DNA-binding SARP family transcriptional activator